MTQLARRSLLTGFSVAALLSGQVSRVLAQQQDRVQRGEVKKFPSMIPGVAHILVREVTYLSGGKTTRAMPHSMVCECKAGVLEVAQDGMKTTIDTGGMWTCHKGMMETVENKGTAPAIMRVIELVPA